MPASLLSLLNCVGRCVAPLAFLAVLLPACLLTLSGCGTAPSAVVVGRPGVYDYSPSVIQAGNVQQFWWCGYGQNPDVPSQMTDTILYETIDTVTHQKSGPRVVLAESANQWDSQFTCNPRVIRGTFQAPLQDGQTYTYAMYYVATPVQTGTGNALGVAFSNDGIAWKKYPNPVLVSSNNFYYGLGQPSAYNSDGKSAITLLYEDSTGPVYHHTLATSPDGIHFTTQGIITINGIDPANPNPSWGDIGYDPVSQLWYAAFNLPSRNPSTTGQLLERAQYGFQLYRIPAASLLTGATPWQLVGTVDTNLTGEETNSLAGFLKDGYGNLNVGPYPKLQLFTSMSDPQPYWNAPPETEGLLDDPDQWDIGTVTWDPHQAPRALNRYVSHGSYQATTGWLDPVAAFVPDSLLGHLYPSPQQGAATAFYNCKAGATGYFISSDPACNGQHIQGLEGYGYAAPVAGLNLVPLYNCAASSNNQPQCSVGGVGTAAGSLAGPLSTSSPGTLLGYALP